MIDPKLLVCDKCGLRITTQEHASYGFRCENCYIGRRVGTTGSIASAIRQGFSNDRHSKTCRNSIKPSG